MTGCKSRDCHNDFAYLSGDSGWEGVCLDCQAEVENLLSTDGSFDDAVFGDNIQGDSKFEAAESLLRRKRLTTEDVPEWIVKTIEHELDVEQQTMARFGEDGYEDILDMYGE